VDLPTALTSKLYLLAYDTDKKRLTARSQFGAVMRAGALTELYLAGHLSEVDGKPKATASRVTDPVLDGVLQEIAQSRPRSWAYWVGRGRRATFRAVQERLEDSRQITVEPYRILGIFPASRVTLRNPRLVPQVRDAVTRTLRGELPANRVDPADAALAAIAAAGELRIAVSRRQARESKQRIAQLSQLAGPAVPALRKVIAQQRAAAASAGG
jgi:hypothetical protein